MQGANNPPTAVEIGERNTVHANIYAPNGPVVIGGRTTATGAFVGRRLQVGESAVLTLESAF